MNNFLAIRVGRCQLRPVKLGRSETDDPWTSFPEHVGPAARMGRTEQLELDLRGVETPEPLDWVIGHYGSWDEGLRAIRLHAVGAERAADGRITQWSAVETFYEVDGAADVPLAVLTGGQADAVPIPEPEIEIREAEERNRDNERP